MNQQHRAKFNTVCGHVMQTDRVCCDMDQLDALASSSQVALSLLTACPACWNNFISFFCHMTCSPRQSEFAQVTKTMVSPQTQKEIVTELQVVVGHGFGDGFYDSCKQVKFPADNRFVMDLIGGGATDYLGMLRFMGTERAGGSPFQINFPEQVDGLVPLEMEARACHASSMSDRCSCVDCDAVCPRLDPLPDATQMCMVGNLSCLSFSLLVVFLVMLLSLMVFREAVRRNMLIYRDTSGFQPVAISAEDARLLNGQDEGTTNYAEGQRMNQVLHDVFYRLGVTCARYTWQVIFYSSVVVAICSIGWIRFSIETRPEKLWVSETSVAAQEKAYFDEHFGPFYRTEQLILSSTHPNSTIVSQDGLELLFAIQDDIKTLVTDQGTTLDDFCLKPSGNACVIQSITGYWQDNAKRVNWRNWDKQLLECTRQPVNCLPAFKQPLRPDLVLGGVRRGDNLQAKALIVTYVLKNTNAPEYQASAARWEAKLLNYLDGVRNRYPAMQHVRLSYSTDISIEQELNKSSNTDVKTVVLSYLAMFLYISLALGRLYKASSLVGVLVESKFLLGLSSIVIVLASVSVSVGVFSMLGYSITLIIAEVIPFLVLAIGVDNVFILVNEFNRVTEEAIQDDYAYTVEQRVGQTLGRMGPSILLSAIAETLAFGLGALVSMPAVSTFAMYASMSVLVNFLLQITCFVSLLAMDARRTEDNRMDCIPWIQLARTHTHTHAEGPLQSFVRHYYSPIVLSKSLKPFFLLSFVGFFFVCIAFASQLELGLDQKIALPNDSYLIPYFEDLSAYFQTGPPVYFVTKDADTTTRQGQRALCGRFSTCNAYSLANVLEQERKRPTQSYIAQPSAVWLDDFFHWLNPTIETCCRFKRGTNRTQLCAPTDDDDRCDVCLKDQQPPWNITMDGLPQDQPFNTYLSAWLSAQPDDLCPLGGKAAYSDAIARDASGNVIASTVRTYHTPLTTQSDFIQALANARRIAQTIATANDVHVFPYSIFYIFFEQYLNLVSLTAQLLALAISVIGLVCWILLGSTSTTLCVLACVVMIVVDVLGVMAIWDVSLNAISLVNLMICVGLSVEFCCHIARAFLMESGGRSQRAHRSLVDVGSSVMSGILLTKVIGVSILAFSQSKIFVVYYFRMYMAIVVLASLHGLVLLPIVLSLIGGDAPIKVAILRRQVLLEDGDDEDEMEGEGRVILVDANDF